MKLIIGNGTVEVANINPVIRTLSLLITMPCTIAEIKTPAIEVKALHKASFALWYLQQEGFIQPEEQGWFFHVGLIAKEPNDQG